MAPQRPDPKQLKIGFPHDPVKVAKSKEQTLNNLLSSRARAWDGYFDGLSLAYIDAHTQHTATLSAIKEKMRSQQQFLRNVVLGVLLPSLVGGGMAALVTDKGAAVTKLLLPVATKRQAMLASFATGGTATITKDLVKQELAGALSQLVPQPGAEWDAVGDSPIKFFIKLRKMVNDYTTEVTRSVESARDSTLDDYVNTVNAHLLSPFIQNAPMNTEILFSSKELAPIFEIFLWVVWARDRNVKYWRTTIGLANELETRSFVGKVWDGVTQDQHALDVVKARDAVMQLDPILARLVACGINQMEVTQGAGFDRNRRILNILWVKLLGNQHQSSLLSDLIANLDAKFPTSALDGKPIDKSRRLK